MTGNVMLHIYWRSVPSVSVDLATLTHKMAKEDFCRNPSVAHISEKRGNQPFDDGGRDIKSTDNNQHWIEINQFAVEVLVTY